MVIGYYVHHRGAGHLHRALAIADALSVPVTILSSLPRPAGVTLDWVHLPVDTDGGRESRAPGHRDANGMLHWVPRASPALRHRMAALAAWIDSAEPAAIVVDVSVEVALLARLHGIPIVTVAQPGVRDDSAHRLGYDISDAIIAPWPPGIRALHSSPEIEGRLEAVGAISRIATSPGTAHREPQHITVFSGQGGRGESALQEVVDEARFFSRGYRWNVLAGASVAKVTAALATSSLVISHCGQNAVAEIAASRVPAIFVPEDRPHAEQESLARALGTAQMPARVVTPGSLRKLDWPSSLSAVAELDGETWAPWCDGAAATRAAAIILRVAGRSG